MTPDTRWSNFRASFQFKLFSLFTLLTFVISCLLSTAYIVSEIHESRVNASEHLKLQTKQLGESIRLPLYAENRDILQQIAVQAAKTPQIHSVVISAPDGRILAEVHSHDHSVTTEMITSTSEVHSSDFADSVASAITGEQNTAANLIGTVRIERGTADLLRSFIHVTLISVGAAFVFWLMVTALCYLVLRRVTRSFNALIHGIDAIEKGDLFTRIDIESDDEPSRAARAINNLAATLQIRDEENIRLQEERLTLERQMLQAQKLESLGVMAGGIAHDYNNLLQSILGNIELASMNLTPDSESHKYIASAMKSGKHAAHLTGLMLTYAGKGLIAKKELNLNELVEENAEILRMATSTVVPMELSLSKELPAIIADEAQIQQLVMNLIINASESIQEHPGLVRLTTGVQSCDQACLATSLLREKPEPGRFVFLEVSDNGSGMSEDILKRLFDPFFTTKFAGRGLGLSAVKGIIKIHGGALFVESEPGKGTSFRVLFPIPESVLSDDDNKTAVTPPPPENGALPAERTLSGVVLVVDDEKDVLKICAKMVKLSGFTVITACDGADAVTKFREHADEIVAVLMDLTMPNMDGITAMSEIFGIRPDARVILSSGFNEDDLSERITGQAPTGFIRKPYSMNVLKTELQRVVRT